MIFKDLIFYRSPILSHTGYILDTYWIRTGYNLEAYLSCYEKSGWWVINPVPAQTAKALALIWTLCF